MGQENKLSKLILVVDDSTTMLVSMQVGLEHNGFVVQTAHDGVDALAKINAGLRPDLIITDINMPNMGGLELVKNIREILRFTPILALTTEIWRDKREQAKQLGVTGWLVKPVSGQDLVKVIKQLIPGA